MRQFKFVWRGYPIILQVQYRAQNKLDEETSAMTLRYGLSRPESGNRFWTETQIIVRETKKGLHFFTNSYLKRAGDILGM